MSKILVVDDDPDILMLTKTILSLHNFNVEAIINWEDIEDRLINFKPDLVLLDVSLNGADGRDICKKIKHAEETKHLPVVLFSANLGMENEIANCLAGDFIAKPFEISNLLKTIRSNLA